MSRPQTYRDWFTRTYNPSVKQVGTAALDDISLGYADPIQAWKTGENVANIRARTADAQAALGPMAPIINAATYAVPVGSEAKVVAKLAPRVAGALARNVGRYGAAGIEGGLVSGAGSIGHKGFDPEHPINPDEVIKDTAWGTAAGFGGQAAGDAVAAAARPIIDYVTKKPGRGGEKQWDWRTRAASGDAGRDSVRAEVAAEQFTRPPNDPAQPALAKTQEALGQSIEPGLVAHAATGLGGAISAKFGIGPTVDPYLGMLAGTTAGTLGSTLLANPVARGINRIDRNINTGQAFDQLYPALYGPKSTTNTSGWADALRRLTIGGEGRPGPPGSQFW
jgi:hypothetical protein